MISYIWAIVAGLIVMVIMLILSPVITPTLERWGLMIFRKQRTLSYKDILEAADELCEDIMKPEKQYTPDFILGIDGGGCIVASLLGQGLKKPVIEFAADRTGPKPVFPKDKDFSQKLNPIIQGKKIPLVDDLSNTGNTLSDAKKKLKDIANEIRVAVISKPHRTLLRERGMYPLIYDYSIERFDHKGKGTIRFPWPVW